MGRRVTHEEFEARIQRDYPGKYTFLSKYIGYDDKIHITYNKCGHDDWVKPYHLKRGYGCGICNPQKTTTDYVRQFIDSTFDGYELVGEYTERNKNIIVRHKCGCQFPVVATTVLDRKACTCPKCSNKNHWCFKGINDIHTTDPLLFDLLVDKNVGYTRKSGSKNETDFICPYCGNVVTQIIRSVWISGVNCPTCRTNISYPERYFANVLEQLNIIYKFQFSPDWAGLLRYDFMFILNGIKYIVELDGSFHFKDNYKNGKTAEQQKFEDCEKQQLAEKRGYTVIRIDCDYTNHNRGEYIKTHIINSELAMLLDFSSVDFDICNKKALYFSLVRTIADSWNEGGKTISDLCLELGLSKTTIRKRLVEAYECGLIKDSPDDISKIDRHEAAKKRADFCRCRVKCNETGEIFPSFASGNKKYHANISEYFKEGFLHSGKLPDGTKLTWTRI